MYTVERIRRLLSFTGLRLDTPSYTTHEILDLLDIAMNIDTATIPSKECECLWHIGKACHARRQVGARLALLEECMARVQVEKKISKEIKALKAQYAYG